MHVRRAQFAGQFAQFVAQAVADLFSAEHNAAQALAMHAFLRRLVQQVIDKSGNANEHVGAVLAEVTQVAFGAHHLAAAGAQRQQPSGRARVMGQPERQVRRERQRVEHPLLTPAGANLHHPPGGGGEVGQVALRKENRRRLRASARRKRHENGPELGFQFLFHRPAAIQQRAQHGRGTPRQRLRVRRQDEISSPLGMLGRVQQVGFGGERDLLQVLQRTDRIGRQPVFLENPLVVRRERQDHRAQIVPQLFGLQMPNRFFRQPLPPILQ